MGNISVRELSITGLLAFLTMTVAVVAFFGFGFTTGERLPFAHDHLVSDLWHQNLPFRFFFHQSLAEGQLPLWCPELGTGYPLFAEGQVGALYPPNLVFHLLFPFAAAFNLTILFSMVIAGTFASMFSRQVGAGRGPAILAALIFGLSGWFLVHLKHVNLTAAAAFAPLLLLLLDRIGAGAGRRTIALLAVAIGAMLLAGSAQIAYYNLLLGSFYALLLAMRKNPWRARLRPLGAWLAAVLIGFLLAAPQLLPSLELKRLGPRDAGVSLEAATVSNMAPRHLLLFVAPKAFGDFGTLREVEVIDESTGRPIRDPATGRPLRKIEGFESSRDDKGFFWEVSAYVGILPLLLAAAAVLLGIGRRAVACCVVILALSILLALGRNGGLFPLLFGVLPGLDWFRIPGRFLVHADLMLAVLAALGATRLIAILPKRRRGALGAGAVGVAALVIVLDLHLALGDQNPTVPADRWLSPPETIETVLAREGDRGELFRTTTIDPGRLVFRNAHFRARGWTGDLAPYDPARLTIPANMGMLFGLATAPAYSALPLPWTSEVMGLLHYGPDPRSGLPRGRNPRISRLLNVRYFIDPFGAADGGLVPLAEFPGDVLYQGGLVIPFGPPYRVRLFADPEVWPRAFLVPEARIVKAPARNALLAEGWDPQREVLITESEPGPRIEPSGVSGGQARILSYEPVRVAIETTAEGAAWLFLGDSWYPGWEATIDGRTVPIRRANVFGRTVHVPAGRHEVVFTYRCAAFDRGVLLAGLGVALVLALVLTVNLSRSTPGADIANVS